MQEYMSDSSFSFNKPGHNYGTRLRSRKPGGGSSMSREDSVHLNTEQGEQVPTRSGSSSPDPRRQSPVSVAAGLQHSVIALVGAHALASQLTSAKRALSFNPLPSRTAIQPALPPVMAQVNPPPPGVPINPKVLAQPSSATQKRVMLMAMLVSSRSDGRQVGMGSTQMR